MSPEYKVETGDYFRFMFNVLYKTIDDLSTKVHSQILQSKQFILQ